jgi:nucleoid-associated protein YgaU
VVTRRRKLLTAGAVLVTGTALAWPLRRSDPITSARLSIAAPAEQAPVVAEAFIPEPTAHSAVRAPFVDPAVDLPLHPLPLAASAASHPASEQRPAFSTVSNGTPLPDANPPAATDGALVHVIHEGDSLDRLAKRYLGDEARALEIFDLNRDVLDNPHVLRIGVELRIPVTERGGD